MRESSRIGLMLLAAWALGIITICTAIAASRLSRWAGLSALPKSVEEVVFLVIVGILLLSYLSLLAGVVVLAYSAVRQRTKTNLGLVVLALACIVFASDFYKCSYTPHCSRFNDTLVFGQSLDSFASSSVPDIISIMGFQ